MKLFPEISDELRDWALEQPVFFTASAPLAGKHINCSPKGVPSASFCIFDPNHCAYVDTTGSSAETIAHCYENGRVTIMFCSFGAMARILRFFCWGSVIEHDSPDFEPMLKRMGKERHIGQRAIIMLEVWKVQTSCGMSVPLLAQGESDETSIVKGTRFEDRMDLHRWSEGMDKTNKLTAYREKNNSFSNDGLPAMKLPRRALGHSLMADEIVALFQRARREQAGFALGFVACVIFLLALRSLSRMGASLVAKPLHESSKLGTSV